MGKEEGTEDGIYKVDTVPPPDGEGDAYNAPTRIGAGPPEAVLEALKQAAVTGAPMKPPALPTPRAEASPQSTESSSIDGSLDEDDSDGDSPDALAGSEPAAGNDAPREERAAGVMGVLARANPFVVFTTIVLFFMICWMLAR